MREVVQGLANVLGIVVGAVFLVPLLWRAIGHLIRRRVLQGFWGPGKNVLICYPSYPNERIGRSIRLTGHYVSSDDARGVGLLSDALTRLGYQCTSRLVEEPEPVVKDLSSYATIVLVCSPKLDPASGQVVTDRLELGGNALSSWFYKSYPEFGIRLKLADGGRKQFHVCGLVVTSSMDEGKHAREDRGLLARLHVGERQFVLCWGLHGEGTLGAVQAALDPKALRKLPLGEPDVMAEIRVRSGSGRAPRSRVDIIHSDSLLRGPHRSPKKPNPHVVDATLPLEAPVFGMGYVWATPDNLQAAKNGQYGELRPVAAEVDLPLRDASDPSPPAAQATGASGAARRDHKRVVEVVSRLRAWGVRLLVLKGEQDPLLCSSLESAVEACSKVDVWSSLETDGYLLGAVRAFHLMYCGVSEIRLSLGDVSNAQNYSDALHVSAERFEKVAENCQGLLDLRQRNGFTTRVGLSLTVSEAAMAHLEQTVRTLEKWVEEVGPFDYAVTEPAAHPADGGEQAQCPISDETYCDRSLTVAERLRDAGVARHSPVPRPLSAAPDEAGASAGGPSCLAAPLCLRVRADGDLFFCGGRLQEDSPLGSIWNEALDIRQETSRWISSNLRQGDCPVRLCRLPAVNDVLGVIEQARVGSDSRTQEKIEAWLRGLGECSAQPLWGSTVSPSVPGIWE